MCICVQHMLLPISPYHLKKCVLVKPYTYECTHVCVHICMHVYICINKIYGTIISQ